MNRKIVQEKNVLNRLLLWRREFLASIHQKRVVCAWSVRSTTEMFGAVVNHEAEILSNKSTRKHRVDKLVEGKIDPSAASSD